MPKPFPNDIVFSEFIFHYISLKSEISPLTMKGKKELGKYIDEKKPLEFLNQFGVLQVNEEIVTLAYSLMRKYSLLPNVAIILATCIYHSVDLLVSLDGDFEEACKSENIRLSLKAEDV